jgi:catechol 2,3-dioxygenase-like lactoylglutathione lyase family enzyme
MHRRTIDLDRRRFLAGIAGAVVAAHGCAPSDQPTQAPVPAQRAGAGPRILAIELLSAAPLTAMKAFYHQLLGLQVLDEHPERLTLRAGETRLTFKPAAPDDGQPFYHFAFNIPENKVLAARRWQKERTPLLPIPERLRDSHFPDDVVDYRHWNAHSIFFFDPAGNVVEYIARHDLRNAVPGEFSSGDILCASEIAFVVDDVPAAAQRLREVVGVEQYRGGSEQFTALGDERGLLLVMQRGRVISFDAEERKPVSVFRTAATVRGTGQTRYAFAAFPYVVSVEART